ncbi:hypothetical protein [Nocardia thailandica]
MSTPTQVEIRIRTVCVVGTDPVDGHDVDIDTVLDADGLPRIPKNRMSARFRDAALTVLAGPDAGPAMRSTAIELFGAAFATSSRPRLLRVGAATWPIGAAASVRSALEVVDLRYGDRALLRRRISRALTVEIGQTAIGADGAPRPGSLRFVRGIRPGVVLRAPLTWTGEPTAAHLSFLARSVLALRQIGHGASDNHGQVTCSLDGDFDRTVALAYPEEIR